uniref:PPM-type phosphatase domain-containing protein n=1 Tax=Parascaris equorum TaxID=6256 RepID=A0A914RG53_PAREQ
MTLNSAQYVRVVDLHKLDSLSDKDVLVLASDGLWDVLNNEDVALIVKAALNNNETAESLKVTTEFAQLNFKAAIHRSTFPSPLTS